MFQAVRILLTLLITTSALSAASYDSDILNIYTKLSPRFILMSTQKEHIKNEIKICLLHNELDEATVSEFENLTKKNFPNGIREYKLRLIKSNYDALNQCKGSELMFLLNSNEASIKNAVKFSEKNRILLVAYDAELLQDGVDISLFIGRKTEPYINVTRIEAKNIKLDNILLRISKIYSDKIDGDIK